MADDIQGEILQQLREIRAEMGDIRKDVRGAMIEVESLRAKMLAMSAVAGFIAAGIMHIAGQVFFS